MHNTCVIACAATVAATLYGATARADEAPDPNAEKRRRVQHAEEEQMLDERMARLDARRKDTARELNEHEHESALWGHRGRVVVPSILGVGAPDVFTLGANNPFASSSIVSVTKLEDRNFSATIFAVRPNIDWFFTDRWSLGVDAVITSESYDYGTSGFTLGALPRIGRTFEVGPVTLWSRLGAGYAERHFASAPSNGAPTLGSLGALGGFPSFSERSHTLTARADLDVVAPLGRYLLFTAGPQLSYAHAIFESSGVESQSADTLNLGLHASLGLSF